MAARRSSGDLVTEEVNFATGSTERVIGSASYAALPNARLAVAVSGGNADSVGPDIHARADRIAVVLGHRLHFRQHPADQSASWSAQPVIRAHWWQAIQLGGDPLRLMRSNDDPARAWQRAWCAIAKPSWAAARARDPADPHESARRRHRRRRSRRPRWRYPNGSISAPSRGSSAIALIVKSRRDRSSRSERCARRSGGDPRSGTSRCGRS